MLTKKTPAPQKKESSNPNPTQETPLFGEKVSAQKMPEYTPPFAKTSTTSCVIIKFDVGFHNHLTIRGKGANLTWSKGIPLKNKGVDEWVWETDAHFGSLEYKVLVNDHLYEKGDNHTLKQGQTAHYTPTF